MDVKEILFYARIAYKDADHQILDACVELLKEESHKARTPHKKTMLLDEVYYWQRKLDKLYDKL